MRWSDNDALFFRELAEGRRWQTWIAGELRRAGLEVEEPPLTIRDRIEDASRWSADDSDLIVHGPERMVLEVKSRGASARFWWDGDRLVYPYPTALVDTVAGWEAKRERPRAVLVVCRQTRAVVVVSAATQPRWERVPMFDRVRGIRDLFYTCPVAPLRPLPWLIRRLTRPGSSAGAARTGTAGAGRTPAACARPAPARADPRTPPRGD